MKFSDLSKKMSENGFPNVPLDDRDRKIIEITFRHLNRGAGFNKIVNELKSFISRSTVAFRVARLCRLGYLERLPRNSPGDIRPVRVSFRCFSLLNLMAQEQGKLDVLAKKLRERRQESGSDNLNKWYIEMREQWNGLFAMAGSVALLYGERAALDIFLPVMMEGYRNLISELFSSIENSEKSVAHLNAIIGKRLRSKGTTLGAIHKEVKKQQEKWENP